ncbi:hypothetical protein EV177_009761, partial [Coemansia sp. RSA 1804]
RCRPPGEWPRDAAACPWWYLPTLWSRLWGLYSYAPLLGVRGPRLYERDAYPPRYGESWCVGGVLFRVASPSGGWWWPCTELECARGGGGGGGGGGARAPPASPESSGSAASRGFRVGDLCESLAPPYHRWSPGRGDAGCDSWW